MVKHTRREVLLSAGALVIVPLAARSAPGPKAQSEKTQDEKAPGERPREKAPREKASSPPSAIVRMYSQHPEQKDLKMVFWPRVVRVQPGTTVRFVPEDTGHNTMSTPGMVPEGAKAWRGPFNKPFEVKLTRPGYYGFHCMAHRSMGMVGLIVVEGEGRDDNLEAARAVKHMGAAQEVWKTLWEEALNEPPRAGKQKPAASSTAAGSKP